MTEEEISRIKKHIEIHARQEREAVIITRVLRKAVDELEHIADLEKENAELKESVTKFSEDGLAFLHSMKSNRNCIDCESKMSIQLTKAKEIIKTFLGFAEAFGYSPSMDKFMAEAEQFIK